MTTYQPYTYMIGWSHVGVYYIGVRFAKNCSPAELWKSYFTSSIYVTAARYVHGEPDIRVTVCASSREDAVIQEDVIQFYLNAVASPRYLNRCRGGHTFQPSLEGRKRSAEHSRSPKRRTEQAERSRGRHIAWSDESRQKAREDMSDPLYRQYRSDLNRARARTMLFDGKMVSVADIA